jgi:hypothetical protein
MIVCVAQPVTAATITGNAADVRKIAPGLPRETRATNGRM